MEALLKEQRKEIYEKRKKEALDIIIKTVETCTFLGVFDIKVGEIQIKSIEKVYDTIYSSGFIDGYYNEDHFNEIVYNTKHIALNGATDVLKTETRKIYKKLIDDIANTEADNIKEYKKRLLEILLKD
jgi:hypothetical protein